MTRQAPFRMRIDAFALGAEREGYQPVTAFTDRGEVHFRYYGAPAATRAALWVGGVGGGWDTPAHGLYPTLARELLPAGIASLRVRFRHPGRLAESVLDVLGGLAFLESQGVEAAAVVGHSFGGAVVIQAAVQSELVRTVVTLAGQSYGAECVDALRPETSILLLHGTDDAVLPAFCSEHLAELAHDPRRLIRYPGAGHCLDEVASEVHDVVRTWLQTELVGP